MEKFETQLNGFIVAEGYRQWKHDNKVHATGPFIVTEDGKTQSFGTHGPGGVKVYYSPQVWKWMESGRSGPISDGSMIIKEIYNRDPKNLEKFQEQPSSYSIMVRDSKGSWDGWFWSDGGPLQKPRHADAERFFDPNAGFGLACMNCHATAVKDGTFSSLRSVVGNPITHTTIVSPMRKQGEPDLKVGIHSAQEKTIEAQHETLLRRPGLHWETADKVADRFIPDPLPLSAHDHVVQGPQPNGRKQFITADQCMACHDATQSFTTLPNMALKQTEIAAARERSINLSPFSEWRYSLMGLSGRDPVFFAQLESERALHPELASEIDNNCLSCHAVMGQRQWHSDRGGATAFTYDITAVTAETDPQRAAYGALARDGVSCVACHRMLPDGLGTPETYSGNFKLSNNPTEIYGPYEKSVTFPMEQSVGLTPKFSDHVRESKLCSTCHTVETPSLDPRKKYTAAEFNAIATRNSGAASLFHEQTTFLEWNNSVYASSENKMNCQGCHMPQAYKRSPLKFKIANIEDDTYPFVENRAPDEQIALTVRGDNPREAYSRHSLHGINLFVTEMFNQFPALLGIPRKDALFPGDEVESGLSVAIDAGVELAREATARVEITDLRRTGKGLSATVKVTNLAGHKFPTGVAFRRAFIEFKVLSGDKTLFVSGATDEWGVIGKFAAGKFEPLPTELFEGNQYQPHHTTISRDDQVQIFEELITDAAGDLTTSFMSYKSRVKDNRIPPRGWRPDGPDAGVTHAVGVGNDSNYSEGNGASVVTYNVALDNVRGPISAEATLYYQSIPPYYLKERFKHVDQPASKSLFYFVNQMKTESGALKNWKLEIASDKRELK